MLTRQWMPWLSAAGAALLLSACAVDATPTGVTSEESSAAEVTTAEAEAVSAGAPDADASTIENPDPDAKHRGGQQIIGSSAGVEFLYISPEDDDGTEVVHLRCQDEEALATKAEHNDGAQPLGWPQEWDGTGPMPDPLCHPDYLQIDEWEDLEAFSACWEGTETSTLVRGGQSQDEVDEFLWHQSQARADWEQNPTGGTCAEQLAANDA